MKFREKQMVRVVPDLMTKPSVRGVTVINSMKKFAGNRVKIEETVDKYETNFYRLSNSDCLWHESWLIPVCEIEEIE